MNREWIFVATSEKKIEYVNLDHIVSIGSDPDDWDLPPLAVIHASDGRTIHTDMTVEELIDKINSASTK